MSTPVLAKPEPFTPDERYASELAVASQTVIAAVHDEGPDAVRAAVEQALAVTAPSGIDPVHALVAVLAAQVDPDLGIAERFGWVTEGLDGVESRPGPDLNAARALFGLPAVSSDDLHARVERGTLYEDLDESDRRDVDVVAAGYRPAKSLPRALRPAAMYRAVNHLGMTVVDAGRMMGITDATARGWAREAGLVVGAEGHDATVESVLAGRRKFAELPTVDEREEAVRVCIEAGMSNAMIIERLQGSNTVIGRYTARIRKAAKAAGQIIPITPRVQPVCIPSAGPSAVSA